MPDEARSNPPEAPRGLVCSECGCDHFEVIWTDRQVRKIVRRRECRNCGKRIRTTERIDAPGSSGGER